jgi:replicative DNA helicase
MNDMETLRLPPHSLEAEQAVIGSVLAAGETMADLDLIPEDFYRREHIAIWTALRELQEQGRALDVLTLRDRLALSDQLTESGGVEYLAELASGSSNVSNLRHYAAIVAERALERRLITAAMRIADMGYNADGRTAAERLTEAAGMLNELDRGDVDEPVSVDKAMASAVDELQRRIRNQGQLLGTPTGWEQVDARTQGLMPGNLVVVAGRPAMGKSVFAANLAEHVALQGKLAIVFNLEMSIEEMMFRLIAAQARVPMDKLRVAGLEGDQWDRVSGIGAKVRGRPLYVSDNPILTSAQVLSRARRIARRLNMTPGLVVVDYLQLLNDKGDNLNERTARISRNLKLAAKALGCPVVALSQLNRKVDDRADRRPMMSDLRDSGAVEQDADLIAMLYRDEVYNPGSTHAGTVEVIWRKFRNGQTGTDLLAANLQFCRFDNLPHGWRPAPPPPSESQTRQRKGGFEYGRSAD